MSVLYTSAVSKEQQKNRCFVLPAVPISRSQTFRDGSLKQELPSLKHSLQNSCLPFSIGVNTPHPYLRNVIVLPYRQPVNTLFTIFSQFLFPPPRACPGKHKKRDPKPETSPQTPYLVSGISYLVARISQGRGKTVRCWLETVGGSPQEEQTQN
jgi:hypothetical protein